MDTFIKATAGVLIAVVLVLVLDKQEKYLSALLTIAVCCMVITGAVTVLNPVIELFNHLSIIAELDSNMLSILLKVVGLGVLGEVTNLICTDAGNAAMGKALQIMSTAMILWMSLPIFRTLIDLMEEILVAT